ncbi:unnamed protein product [Gongylonema pulchrum]|uniref:Chromo domain-containing protein n=1 Tax=Gongylonema pulchrum TaxID=637853 RepID=A0A183EV28_9BILA|nr:unnamed protein product [Gongylonema pulchrum]
MVNLRGRLSASKDVEEQRRSADRPGGSASPPPPPTRNDDALIDGRIVDKLIGRRSHEGSLQYLVCWYGVPEEDTTWVNAEKLVRIFISVV